MTLTHKLLGTALLPVMAGGVVMVSVGFAISKRDLQQQADENARLQVAVYARGIEAFLSGHVRALQAIAASEVLWGGDLPAIRRELRRWQSSLTDVEALYYDQPDGIVHDADGRRFSVADRPYFAAVKRGEIVLTHVSASRATGAPIVLLLVPIHDGAGRWVGALGASVLVSQVARQVAQMKVGRTGYALLVDDEGQVIGGTSPGAVPDGEIGELLAALRRASSGPLSVSLGGEPCRVYGQHVPPAGWSLALVSKDAETFAKARRAGRVGLAMVGGAGALGALLALTLRILLLLPIRRLMVAQQRLADGDLEARAPVTSGDELGQLAASFNEMATALGEARRQLHQSEALFRTQFELGNIGAAITSPEHRWLRVNSRLCEMLGYSAEELQQRTWSEMTHADDLDADLTQFGRLTAGEIDAYEMPKRFIRKDGSVLPTHLTVSCNRSPEGRVDFIISAILDATEQRRAEGEVRRATEEALALNRLSRTVAAQSTLDDVCRAAADELRAALAVDRVVVLVAESGVLAPKATSSGLSEPIPPHQVGQCLCGLAAETGEAVLSSDTRNDPRCTWRDCLEMGIASFAAFPLRIGDETVGVLGVGSRTPRDFAHSAGFLTAAADQLVLGVRNAKLYDESLAHAHALAQEMAERRLAEEALRQSESRLQLAITAAQDAIWEWDLTTGVAYCSPRWYEMLGYADGEFTVDTDQWQRLCHPDDAGPAIEALRRTVASQDTGRYGVEFRLRAKDGAWVWVLGRGNVVERDASGRALRFSGTVTDISERKAAEQAIEESQRQVRDIAANIPGVIYQFVAGSDGSMSLTYLGERPTGMFGVDRDWARDFDHVLSIVHPDDRRRFIRSIQEAVAAVAPWQFEGRFVKPSGEVVWVSSASIPQRRGDAICFNGVMLDVTAFRRAEEERDRLTELLECSPDLVATASLEGVVTYMNPAGRRMVGWSDAVDLSGFRIPDVHPDWAAQIVLDEAIPTANANGVWQGETAVLRSDGTEVPVWQVIIGHRGDDGTRRWLSTMMRDISEAKRAERALVESERRFRALFDNALDAIFVIDNGVLVDCNPRTLELFAGTREQILGRSPAELSPPHQPDGTLSTESAARRISAALAGTPQVFEWRHTRLDGTGFDASVTLNRMLTEDGYLVQAMLRDITEAKRAERALVESEHRFRTVFDMAPLAIILVGPDGRYRDANQTACQQLGRTLEEVIGCRNEDVFEYEDPTHAAAAKKKIWALGRLENEETSIIRRVDNARLRILYSARALEVAGETVLVTVVADITEQRRLEEQLRQAHKMEAIGQLAGGMAHDFNNILQAILGYTDMVLNGMSPDNKHYAALTQVFRAGERAAALTRQLLAFSRRQVLQLAPVDLNRVVEELMRMVRRLIGEHIDLVVMPGHELRTVNADKGQLEQVLLNLCVNARDAMPDGGRLTIETRNVDVDEAFCAAHEWAKPGHHVLLSVSDTGTGMDEETRLQVFEPFFTTKETGKGTGLGLATVYGIVRQHDGMIHVYSEPGKGTRFGIYLPAGEQPIVPAEPAPDGSAIPGGSETVLLAEDNEQTRLLTEQILREAGYRVLVAADGEEALALYAANGSDIDLLLLDVVMPKRGGRAVLDEVRLGNSQAKCLFVSGYSDDAVHTNFILDAGLHLVQKPYSRSEILRAVRRTLDGP